MSKFHSKIIPILMIMLVSLLLAACVGEIQEAAIIAYEELKEEEALDEAEAVDKEENVIIVEALLEYEADSFHEDKEEKDKEIGVEDFIESKDNNHYEEEEYEHGNRVFAGFISLLFYNSIESMTTINTDIIRAEVLSVRSEMVDMTSFFENESEDANIDPSWMINTIYTIYQLRVLEVFKGYAEVYGVIELMQRGGYFEGRYIYWSGYNRAPLNIGDDLVLFLHDSRTEGVPFSMHPVQGAYHVPSTMAYPQTIISAIHTQSVNSDLILESIQPYNRLALTLTIEDLSRIAGLSDSPWP
ncbi:MAG: hypothetical protein FWC76_02610 [Defluviitaleaceae bacterium]|nr:hypothetical protein [Defluviitaleaceae bacterium]